MPPELPDYFLPRPEIDRRPETFASFDRLWASIHASAGVPLLAYQLEVPRWQFLCWLADVLGLVLHGSGDGGVEQFVPRQSNDSAAFGNRRAVYAASDGIWPIYFAIADRSRYPMSLVNAAFRVSQDGGPVVGPYYFFSISRSALEQRPWRDGYVYVLPREGFEQQPPERHRGLDVQFPQWACLSPVRPLARLAVSPGDFPFLADVRGHDWQVVRARAQADPEGFPWLDEA